MDDVISKENIVLKESVKDWEAAIRLSGQLLVNSGAVRGKYVDGMIDLVRKLGPYIVIVPGVAIAHDAPSADVLRDDNSLVILKQPVNFGSKNDPVRLVFGIASVTGNSHLESLRKLANVFGDGDTLETLKYCYDVDKAYALMNSFDELKKNV